MAIGPDGALATLAQDSTQEVGQSLGLLLSTRPGERVAVPGYGLPEPLAVGIDAGHVVEVAREWEERALHVTLDVLQQVISQDVTVHATASLVGGET